jgi:hypothetical protein
MPKYSGDVTLPDGRQFHAVATFTQREWDTSIFAPDGADLNASSLINAEIYTLEGEEVDADVQNELIDWPSSYGGKAYLWEALVDLVIQQPPDEEDYL